MVEEQTFLLKYGNRKRTAHMHLCSLDLASVTKSTSNNSDIYIWNESGFGCVSLYLQIPRTTMHDPFSSSWAATMHSTTIGVTKTHQVGRKECAFSRSVPCLATRIATISQYVWNSELVSEIRNPKQLIT